VHGDGVGIAAQGREMSERDLNGFGAWDVGADGVGYRFEDDGDEDRSVREVAVEGVYISILAMAPPHRPSDVLSVRATLTVPVGRASIALLLAVPTACMRM
jgi:hypothetical protein